MSVRTTPASRLPGALFDSLDVPMQVLRGDYNQTPDEAKERASALLERVPQPTPGCSAIISGARACLPYERAPATARMLSRFVAVAFGGATTGDVIHPPFDSEGILLLD